MSASVSAILSETHGITTQPGAKVECPFCHHKTFSIKRDDLLGKCFHPACGRFITPSQRDGKSPQNLTNVLEAIYHDFHQELLSLQNARYQNAYTYLVTERQIHPRVVADSMLGAVPSGGYNLEAKFTPLIEEAEAAVKESEQARSGKRGRPQNAKGLTPEDRLRLITEALEKLRRCILDHAGWLAFFYTDAQHRIVAIRFRKPYSKYFAYFKPYRTVAGLFGHSLFTPYTSGELQSLNDLLIVTEGEFNQLQLQSLVARRAEAVGKEPDYLSACAVGGVTNADYPTIRQIARAPIICYDHDASSAGFALVEKARETMSVTGFTSPKPDTDLDDFIRSFHDDHHAAWEAVKALVAGRRHYPRHYQAVAEEVFACRQNQGPEDSRREFEINAEVADIIRADLHGRGRFYHDGASPYFFFEVEKQLIAIDPDDIQYTLVLARYGINRAESIYRYLLEALYVEAFERGTRTEVYRLAYYNSVAFTVYVFNHHNQIYRITPDVIDMVDNGTDGILFLSNARAQPFRVEKPDVSDSWLDRIVVSQINFAADQLTPDERRLMFTLWFFALFFESLMRTKPILAFIGPKGSGKSITNRKVGLLLFGDAFDVMPLTEDSKDFDAAVTNSAFVAIDNADTKCEWLNDRLAIVATGGTIKKRELYTTNKMVEIPTHCFLAITSRTPQFRRDDVADRLLIMKVQRFDAFKSEKSLLTELLQNRQQIMSEVVYHLQEVVRALRAGQGVDDSGAFRMADFTDFAIKVARYTGVEDQVKVIFTKLTHEQSAFTLEGNSIFELLSAWAPQNAGREVTNADLCKELAELAKQEGTIFAYEGKTRAFAQVMSHVRSNLEEFFIITERSGGGRKTFFAFTPRQEEHGL
jgi:hypothetical protein